MGPRAGLSTLLVAGAAVLLLAIVIGNGMGTSVLRQVSGRVPEISTTIVPIVTPSPGEAAGRTALRLRRRAVLSVATDPAFPDPRVTPEPSPKPRPTLPRPSPTATLPPIPTDEPTVDTSPDETKAPYTSPPLTFPLVKHSPGETSPPDEGVPSPSASP